MLLITIDTLRADHCSCYGYPLPTTPRLDWLARDGLRFANAYAPMATTGPSHATMLTGLPPLRHGVLENGHALDPVFRTLAEVLHAAGYATAAIVSSFALDSRFGLSRGFDSYDDAFTLETSTIKWREWAGQQVSAGFDRRANDTTDRAIVWLAKRRARPFFLWVHYFDPHTPYVPPAPHRALFAPLEAADQIGNAIAAYDGEVHFTDAEIGRLLDAVDGAGLRETTLVLVIGDHGEGLGQHGWMEHGLHIYEEAVRVPLLMRWPARVKAGRVEPAPVSLVDVTPTILELAGAGGIVAEGHSLAPILVEGAREPERPIFLQRRRYSPASEDALHIKGDKFGLRAGRFKYLEAPEEGRRELYDLEMDPGETRNVATAQPARAQAMAATLLAWRQRAPAGPEQRISPEDAERLRTLGYVQ